MSSLTHPPLAAMIERMFADAAASNAAFAAGVAHLSETERNALMTDATRYKELYSQAKDAYLAVSRETAALLYMLTRATGARSIVEFGTSFGISTLHLAAALRDNGGGRIISTEFEPSKVARARAKDVAAGFADLVEIREGDALETLAGNLPDSIDLALMDGAKALYPNILDLLESRLRPGALLVADNADWSPVYLARVRSTAGGYISVPFGGDVELSMRIG